MVCSKVIIGGCYFGFIVLLLINSIKVADSQWGGGGGVRCNSDYDCFHNCHICHRYSKTCVHDPSQPHGCSRPPTSRYPPQKAAPARAAPSAWYQAPVWNPPQAPAPQPQRSTNFGWPQWPQQAPIRAPPAPAPAPVQPHGGLDFDQRWPTHRGHGYCQSSRECHDRCDLCNEGKCIHVSALPGCAPRVGGGGHDHSHGTHGHGSHSGSGHGGHGHGPPRHPEHERPPNNGRRNPETPHDMYQQHLPKFCPGGCGRCQSCTLRGTCVEDSSIPGCGDKFGGQDSHHGHDHDPDGYRNAPRDNRGWPHSSDKTYAGPGPRKA